MSSESPQSKQRPFVGVRMRCCGTYIRAYPNAQKSAFVGWCPKCAGPVRIPIVKEGGTDAKFFEAR